MTAPSNRSPGTSNPGAAQPGAAQRGTPPSGTPPSGTQWPSTFSLTWSQFRLQQKQFWRNRQTAVFSFALPVLFVILFGLLFRNTGSNGTGGITYTAYFVAGMIGISLMSATFVNLAITLSFQRDLLILKRLRGTPLEPAAIFSGIVANAAVVVVIQVGLILVLGRIFYNTPLPKNPVAFVMVVLAGIVVFAMGGIGFTGFIANADSGPAVVQVPFLTLQFISGVYFPYASEPKFLKSVANVFPLRWFLDAIRIGYLGVDYLHTRHGSIPGGGVGDVPPRVRGLHAIAAAGPAFLVLGAWLAVFIVVARRRFRWERRAET